MLAVIGAVGQAEREAMLERKREGIAEAKREHRYKGRVPTVRRQANETSGSRDGRQALGNRQQTGDRQGQRVSGLGEKERSDGGASPTLSGVQGFGSCGRS